MEVWQLLNYLSPLKDTFVGFGIGFVIACIAALLTLIFAFIYGESFLLPLGDELALLDLQISAFQYI